MSARTAGNFIRKHVLLCAVGAVATLIMTVFVWDASAPIRGRFVARYTLARGQYELLTYGLPARGLPECSRTIRQRYGIHVRPIAGCIVSRSLIAYADAHNKIVMDEIRRKFGLDVLQKCMSDMNSQASLNVPTH